MYADILVPTDGSAGSDRIVEHATGLADAHGATLHLLYVVNTASFATLPMDSSYEGIASMLEEEGDAALDAAAATIDRIAPEIPVQRVVREGSPAAEIIEYATGTGCDLVAMGTHGRGGLNRLLLGSVAERVVRNSPVPVLTVRVGEIPDETAESGTQG